MTSTVMPGRHVAASVAGECSPGVAAGTVRRAKCSPPVPSTPVSVTGPSCGSWSSVGGPATMVHPCAGVNTAPSVVIGPLQSHGLPAVSPLPCSTLSAIVTEPDAPPGDTSRPTAWGGSDEVLAATVR
jgi:hypothetical protein